MKTTNNEKRILPEWAENKIIRFMDKLNAALARCEMTWQIVIMLVLIALLAFANGTVLWNAIHNEKQVNVAVQPLPHASIQSEPNDSILTKEEFYKLTLFNHMLDSLRTTPQGQELYKELMQLHPGIRDSINYLLKYYSPKE